MKKTDLPLLALSCDGAGYRIQLNSGRKDRYPVITPVLCFGYEKRWNQPVTLYEAARVSKRPRSFAPDTKLNLCRCVKRKQERL